MESLILEFENKKADIENSSNENFYYEIKEYIEFILSKRKLKSIFKRLIKQQKKDSKEYVEVSNGLKKEFIEIKNNLEKSNKGNKPLNKKFHEFVDYLSGKIRSTAPLVECLEDSLNDIVTIIENEKKISLNEEKEKIKNLMKEYYLVKERYESKKRVSVWFSLYNLIWIQESVGKDISKLPLFDRLNYGLLMHEIRQVSDKHKELSKEKKEEYMKYLNKVHRFFITELKKKKKIYFQPWWLILLILTPLVFSFILYNPFVEYEIGQDMIKNLSVEEPLNKYHFQIGSFNESEVKDSLIVSYIEEWTRTTTQYRSYDLYFRDKSQISNPKDFILKYNISIENFFPKEIYYQESKMIYEDINLDKQYSLIMIPQITAIQKEDIMQVEARFSYSFYIKKSWKEFILKSVPLFLFWIAGIFALTKVFEKIFGKKAKGD